MTKISLGSVSSGTLRAEDLIPCFADLLDELLPRRSPAIRPTLAKIRRRRGEKYFQSEDASEDVTWLEDQLSAIAPLYCYFGSHPGDGADFGFWVMDDVQERIEEGGMVVDDTSKVPDGFAGVVLLINDHGNMTLYESVIVSKLEEVWSVV